MQSELGVQKKEPRNVFFAVTLCECILAAALIITVTVLKFFAPAAFGQVKKWYGENLTSDTDAYSIINGAENEV